MTDPSSPDLVVCAQRGDEIAIGALYDMHYQAVFRYFQARVGHHQVAEDLTGELFRRMLTGLPQYRAIGLPFRAWLFRIAHNLLVDHYRQESGPMLVSLEQTEEQLVSEDDPAFAAEHKLTLTQAYRALAELDLLQREVLSLRFLSGLSLRETAIALNKTEDAVKALQRRGLMALRLTLAGE
jgi:RNA polymerase sigma-70 factor (ECF subfamily)